MPCAKNKKFWLIVISLLTSNVYSAVVYIALLQNKNDPKNFAIKESARGHCQSVRQIRNNKHYLCRRKSIEHHRFECHHLGSSCRLFGNHLDRLFHLA